MQGPSGKAAVSAPLEPRLDVVGVQHRVLGHLAQAVRAVAHHVGQRAHIHAHLAVEGAQPPERLRRLALVALDQAEAARRPLTTQGAGANGASAALSTTGPAPGPPPPCGVEKVLCRLMCMASTPRSPGRTRPTMALKLAPSQ